MCVTEKGKIGKVMAGAAMIGFLLSACGEVLDTKDYEFDEIEATPTLALPLAYGELGVDDILSKADSANIKVYPDGLVYLEYDETLRTQGVRDLIVIPDKSSITGSIVIPPAVIPPVSSDSVTSFQQERIENFDVSEDLREILMNSGQVVYNVTMTPPNPDFRYAIRITIPEFTSVADGSVFSQDVSGSGQVSLAGYLYNNTNPDPNRITIRYTLIAKQKATPTAVGGTVNTMLSFQDLGYGYVKGFFGGDRIIDVPAERLEIEAFGSSLLDGADISFANPSISFTITNEVGVPTEIEFTALEARKPGSSLNVQINPASPVTVNHPATMGNSATTVVNVTNVKALLDFAPTEFYYKLTTHINKGLTSGLNFVTDTSSMKVNMHIEVPLYGKASNIQLSDTVGIDLSDVDDSAIESASLKVKVFNEIPLDADVQFFLTDANFNVLDALLETDQTTLIESSTVNASGELQAPGEVDLLIPIRKEKLDKIFQAKNIIIRARVNTARNGNGTQPDVKFKSEYKMNVKLGIQAKLKLTADL